jgi:serine/threonine protein kinase
MHDCFLRTRDIWTVAAALPGFESFQKIRCVTFSVVFMCRHTRTGFPAVVKTIPKSADTAARTLDEARREAQLLRTVSHPCVVCTYDFVETDSFLFQVEEYVAGPTLLSYIVARGRLGEPEAQHLFRQLSFTVDYLHNNLQVVHRDLKLENVVVTPHDHVKLIDFGFANRAASPGSLFETNCGSVGYAAPELFLRKPYSWKVDVWSLGVILYAMVAGRMPFVNDNVSQLIEMIVTKNITFPDFFSPPLRSLLSLMLAKDPIKRATISDVLAHSWMDNTHKPLIGVDPEHRNSVIAALSAAFELSDAECERQLREGVPEIMVAYRIITASRAAGVRTPPDAFQSAAALVSGPNATAMLKGKSAPHRNSAIEAVRVPGMARSVCRRPFRKALRNPSFVG